jgi:hypothetical protein
MPFTRKWNEGSFDDDDDDDEEDDGASKTLLNGRSIYSTGASSSDSEDSFDRTPRQKSLLNVLRARNKDAPVASSPRTREQEDNELEELERLERAPPSSKKKAPSSSPRQTLTEKDKIPAIAGGLKRVGLLIPARENNYCMDLYDDFCYLNDSKDYYDMPTVYGNGRPKVLEKIDHLNPYCECYKPTKLTTQWRYHEREPDVRFGEHCK